MTLHLNTIDPIRRDQAAEGARMARDSQDNFSSHSREERAVYRPAGSRPPHRDRVAKPPKGHESFLKQLETSNAMIQIEKMTSGDFVTGTIKTSDKYTVTLRVVDPATGVQTNRVIFKHDISEFTAIDHKPETAPVTGAA